jgi:hypothetical protein
MKREAIVLVFVAVGGLLIVASGLVNHPVSRSIDFYAPTPTTTKTPLRTNSSNASTGSTRPTDRWPKVHDKPKAPQPRPSLTLDHETLVPHSDSVARVMTLAQIAKMTHTKTG